MLGRDIAVDQAVRVEMVQGIKQGLCKLVEVFLREFPLPNFVFESAAHDQLLCHVTGAVLTECAKYTRNAWMIKLGQQAGLLHESPKSPLKKTSWRGVAARNASHNDCARQRKQRTDRLMRRWFRNVACFWRDASVAATHRKPWWKILVQDNVCTE